MRIDLAEALADTGPSVWRFPGGNNLEVRFTSRMQCFDRPWNREIRLIPAGNGMKQLAGVCLFSLLFRMFDHALHSSLEDRPGRVGNWGKDTRVYESMDT